MLAFKGKRELEKQLERTEKACNTPPTPTLQRGEIRMFLGKRKATDVQEERSLLGEVGLLWK